MGMAPAMGEGGGWRRLGGRGTTGGTFDLYL